jgi:hypothetical protein
MPTARQRGGDFGDLFGANGALIPIYDPATTSGLTRSVFPNNRIPANRLDPVSLKVNEYYPLPNRTPANALTNASNFLNVASEVKSMRQYTARIDHRFSDKNSLFARYSYFLHKTDGGGTASYPNQLIAKRDDSLDNKNFALTDTHSFSPTMLNELRLGLTRGYFPFIARSFGGGWPQKLGLPASVPQDTFPLISNGLPGFSTGSAGLRGSLNMQLYDMITKISGNHTMKIGFDLRTLQGNNLQRSQPSGSFSFAGGLTGNPASQAGTGSGYATFLLGEVSSATGTTHLGESERGKSYSVFFQDDWKVSRRFTLNLGLRYDYQTQPKEVNDGLSNFDPTIRLDNGLLGATVFANVDGQPRNWRLGDFNDFAPRIGLAYDLFGSGKTVFRAGYGIYYPSQFWRNNYGSVNGFANTTTTYTSPNANIKAFQFSAGFPTPLLQPAGRSLGPKAFLGQGSSYDETLGTTPMSQQFSASLQHQLPGKILIDVSYSGNQGSHFTTGSYNMNQLDNQYLGLGLALQDQVPNPNAGKVPGALGNATITREQSLLPYPHYLGINVRNPRMGNFNSHLLIVSVEKRMAKGLTFMVNFTGGKIISEGLGTPVDFGPIEQVTSTSYQDGRFNRRLERSVDPADVSKRAVVSLLYELPFGKKGAGFVDRVIGGWQINTIGIMQTGLPVIITGANNFRATRPNSTGVSAKIDDPSVGRWFNTDAFSNPPNYTFGNVGRILPDVRGPGTFNWDLSLLKNANITERIKLQFRAEMFNFMNNVNLGIPNGTFVAGPNGKNQSGTFATITSARDSRNIQFGLKLLF